MRRQRFLADSFRYASSALPCLAKNHLVWVAPAYRRHGIAEALMARAEDAARERNAIGLRLYVGADNPGAVALYTRCGYRDRCDNAHFMDKEW